MQRKSWMRYFKIIKEQRGASAIEFAIVAPVFLFLIIGSIELMTVLWEKYSLNYAVSLAARYVFVYPDSSDAEIESYVNSYLPPLPNTPTYTISVTPNVEATINATIDHKLFFYSKSTITLNSSIEQPLNPTF